MGKKSKGNHQAKGLSRKKNEQLVIYEDLIVTVVEIRGDKVRLGIEHPTGVSVRLTVLGKMPARGARGLH